MSNSMSLVIHLQGCWRVPRAMTSDPTRKLEEWTRVR